MVAPEQWLKQSQVTGYIEHGSEARDCNNRTASGSTQEFSACLFLFQFESQFNRAHCLHLMGLVAALVQVVPLAPFFHVVKRCFTEPSQSELFFSGALHDQWFIPVSCLQMHPCKAGFSLTLALTKGGPKYPSPVSWVPWMFEPINSAADLMSRAGLNPGKWELHPHVIREIWCCFAWQKLTGVACRGESTLFSLFSLWRTIAHPWGRILWHTHGLRACFIPTLLSVFCYFFDRLWCNGAAKLVVLLCSRYCSFQWFNFVHKTHD